MIQFPIALAILIGVTDPSAAGTYPSPGGNINVNFEEIAHRTFSKAEQLQALDNMNHVEYAITFIRRDAQAPAARVTYADVYGFDEPPVPAPLDRLHGWLKWSPKEDFVVVPSEGWASAPGTPERTVLSMNDRFGWSESWMILQNLVWADPLVVVGDRHNDCDYAVDLFDGRTGKQRPVMGAASPVGHQIASVEGRTVVIRRVLDNCASQARRDAFEERCWSLDLDTLTLDAAACP